MRRSYEYGIESVENGKKQVAYNLEFKQLIHSKPGLLKEFKENSKRLASERQVGEAAVSANMTMLLVKIIQGRKIFKVSIPPDDYYVNEASEVYDLDLKERHNGINRIKTVSKQKELLADIPWVDFEDSQFAFREGEKSYFVAKWNDLSNLEDYITDLENKIDEREEGESRALSDELGEIEDKVRILEERLESVYDVQRYNMFYDPQLRKITLFDLHEK